MFVRIKLILKYGLLDNELKYLEFIFKKLIFDYNILKNLLKFNLPQLPTSYNKL